MFGSTEYLFLFANTAFILILDRHGMPNERVVSYHEFDNYFRKRPSSERIKENPDPSV